MIAALVPIRTSNPRLIRRWWFEQWAFQVLHLRPRSAGQCGAHF